MLIEEEKGESGGEVNPDALVAFFEDDGGSDDEAPIVTGDDEQVDEIDIAFQANDEAYW